MQRTTDTKNQRLHVLCYYNNLLSSLSFTDVIVFVSNCQHTEWRRLLCSVYSCTGICAIVILTPDALAYAVREDDKKA